jgi:hypothetical protein
MFEQNLLEFLHQLLIILRCFCDKRFANNVALVCLTTHRPTTYYISFDYIVTDVSGSDIRVAAGDFDKQLNVTSDKNYTASVSVDTSQLSISNQLSLIIYGSYLDPVRQSLISLGLKKTYGAVNQGK